MTVGIACGNVKVVQYAPLIDEVVWDLHRFRDLAEQLCDHMAPHLLSKVKVQPFDGLLCGLLRGEASPLMVARTT